MRQGQLNQVFVYLMVVIVVGAVLIIGYNAVKTIMEQQCTVDKQTFQSTIREYIGTYSDYGAEAPVKIRAPCDYETLCFVNGTLDAATITDPKYSTIKTEVASKTGNTVFLLMNKQTLAVDASVPDLVVINNDAGTDTGFLCLTKKAGEFSFTFRGIERGRLSVSKT